MIRCGEFMLGLVLIVLLSGCTDKKAAPKVLIERAHLQERQNRLAEAVETYTTVLKENPNLASVYYDRGVAYDALGKYDNALADYSKTIELDKGFYQAFNNRAVLHSRRGDHAAAIKDCNETLLLHPQDPLALRNRGIAQLKLSQFDAALADLNQSLQADGKAPVSYMMRGEIYSALKKYDRAIEDYSQALSLEPGLAEALVGRAVCRAALNQFDAAGQDLQAARELDADLTLTSEQKQQLDKIKTTVSIATAAAAPNAPVATTDQRALALAFATEVAKREGFEAATPLAEETWTLRVTGSGRQPKLVHVIVTEDSAKSGVTISTSTVEALRKTQLPVRLLALRPRAASPQQAAGFEVMWQDDEWLNNSSRLRPTAFTYTPAVPQGKTAQK